jgi:DNA polymerase III sliding clamp (beta) subunit (PCNA family)
MKTITFKTKNILEALTKASKIALTKSNILILEGAICKIANSKAEIIATDLNVTLKQKLEYISCSEDFSFEIPNLKELIKTIKTFQAEEIIFNSYQFGENFQTEIILGNKKFSYNVGDANNSFHHNDVISEKIYNINIENLKEKTDKLKKFTGTSSGVRTNAIGINFRNNKIAAISDFVCGCIENEISFEDEFTVNENFLDKIFKVIKGDINFSIDNYSVKFFKEDMEVLCKVERVEFFNYNTIIERQHKQVIKLAQSEIQKLILDLKYLISKKTMKKQPLYIQWFKGEMKAKINDEIFTIENMPTCNEHVTFNSEYLLDILNTFKDKKPIEIGLSVKNQPIFINNDTQKFILCVAAPKENLFEEEE